MRRIAMEIKTKANIGDTIYFISNRKIVSDKIIHIIIEINRFRHLETEIHYFVSRDYVENGIIDESDIAMSVEDLISKLTNNFTNNTEANDGK